MNLKDMLFDIVDDAVNGEIKDMRDLSYKIKKYTGNMTYMNIDDDMPVVEDLDITDSDDNVMQQSSVRPSSLDPIVDMKAEAVYGEKENSVVEGIVQELTPSKLKQAIILSEIINKPICKRNRRGFRRV